MPFQPIELTDLNRIISISYLWLDINYNKQQRMFIFFLCHICSPHSLKITYTQNGWHKLLCGCLAQTAGIQFPLEIRFTPIQQEVGLRRKHGTCPRDEVSSSEALCRWGCQMFVLIRPSITVATGPWRSLTLHLWVWRTWSSGGVEGLAAAVVLAWATTSMRLHNGECTGSPLVSICETGESVCTQLCLTVQSFTHWHCCCCHHVVT